MLIIKQLLVPFDCHSIYFFLHTMEVNGDQQMFGSAKVFETYSFVFNIRKKLVLFGMTKCWQNCHLWVNYSFNNVEIILLE